MTRVRVLAVVAALAAALALAPGAGAIGNGVPDGNGHPNVGLLAVGIEEDGELVRFGLCSGSYGGPRVSQPAEKVFVTAGHCVNWLPEEGVTADQLWVTFDSATTTDPDTDAITSSNTWHQASGIGFDPALGDYGVVLLESVPPGLAPVQLATAGLLDELTAQGGLRPTTVFDNVGYGLVPSFKQGPPQFAYPPGRLFSTSRFKGLTQKFLKLNMNSELEGNGGGCYGDSGSPKFIHDTSTAVAIATGGDPICRANSYNSRLDTSPARTFYGQYLALP
jgi:Trypsin